MSFEKRSLPFHQQSRRVAGSPADQDTEPCRPPSVESLAPSSAEVRELIRRYAQTRDVELRNRLVLVHERLVRYIVSRFCVDGASSQEDLIQVGYLGLIAALERFDPDAGTSFTTFALPTILGVIKHHLRDETWLVRAPRRLRELSGRIRRLRERLERERGRTPTVADLAEAAGISEERILEAMEVDAAYRVASVDAYLQAEDAEPGAHYVECLGGVDPAFARVEEREALAAAISELAPREQAILRHRFFDEESQQQVAARLGMSQMHVSRLERRALTRLRATLACTRQAPGAARGGGAGPAGERAPGRAPDPTS